MIQLTDVTYQRNARKILNGITLNVEKGETSIILGPSGAGKSSILKIILGLWNPDKGSVKIEGEEIANIPEGKKLRIRRKMGIVFQGNALFDSLNVEDNVGFFLRDKKIAPEEEIKRRVAEALCFVDLCGTEKMYPDQLSGGMKKRVAIARTLVFNPCIILYDEPTTGLDPITAKSVIDLIDKVKEQGTTSVMVTHILHDAILLGDSLTIINDGKIIESGNVEHLLQSEDKFVQEFFYEAKKELKLLEDKSIKL